MNVTREPKYTCAAVLDSGQNARWWQCRALHRYPLELLVGWMKQPAVSRATICNLRLWFVRLTITMCA